MITNVVIKFGWTPMKVVGEIALTKLQLHMVLYYEKFQNAIIFAIFGRSPKKKGTACTIMIPCAKFG